MYFLHNIDTDKIPINQSFTDKWQNISQNISITVIKLLLLLLLLSQGRIM